MVKKASTHHAILASFIVDFSDVILNVTVAIISGSAVMLSQALQGGADLLTSGSLLIGLKRSKRKANRDYPFGFGRELFFWTLIAAVMMLTVTATFSFLNGWQQLRNPQPITNFNFALIVLAIGIFTNGYALHLSAERLKLQDPTRSAWKNFLYTDLVEIKATFILDLMGLSAGIFGFFALLIYAATGDARFDGLGAMIIGLTIAGFAIFLVNEVKELLVGRSALPEVEESIKSAALKIKGIEDVLDLRTMYIGSERLLVNIEVKMAKHLSTNALEQLIDNVKAQVKKEVPSVHHIQVELETDVT